MSNVHVERRDGAFQLDAEQVIPCTRDEVFDFFSRAENLERITPDFLTFEVLTPTPIRMHTGARIDYRLKLRGVPIRWRTEITTWSPPHRFVDIQLKGPYREWVHEHRFERVDGGTRVTDHVRYRVLGGRIVNRLFVQRDVVRIFRYRQRALNAHFTGTEVVAP